MVTIKKDKMNKKIVIGSILLFLSVLIIFSVIWANRTLSVETLAQIVFHLKVPMAGIDAGIYLNWFIWCVPVSIIATGIIVLCLLYCHKLLRSSVSKKEKVHRHIYKNFARIGVASVICSLVFTVINYDVYGYLTNVAQKTDIYEQYYVEPSTVDLKFPDQKRNLIHIYLESIETTYASETAGGAYQESYMPELEALALANTSFSHQEGLGGSQTVEGTQWTIASMVAEDAGIPLTIPIYGNSYGQHSLFLPGSYTLGEVLEKEGYNQEFLIGSESEFAGTANFFKQHGNYNIVDYTVALEEGRIPKGYKVAWGFEDEKLFAFAKEDILTMAKEDKPFNLTMATIDPHTPDGHLSKNCKGTFGQQYENVVACQSVQVSAFVEWVQKQDFYANTTIIITGDHLSMNAKFFENMKNQDYYRTPYNVIINPAVSTENTRNRIFTTMDWYPTTLAAMGVEIPGNRLGLGTNMFSNEKTIAEEMGIDVFYNEIRKTSDFYDHEIIGLKK